MGLDSVEILVNVENTFGITISNYEAEKIRTVGDIHNVVWRNVQGRQSMRCKSQQIYYKLRHAFINRFNIDAEVIHPEASLDNIFPKHNRRLLYRRLESELQLKLPALVLSPALKKVSYSIAVVLIPGLLIAAVVLVHVGGYTKWLYMLPGLGLIVTIFLSNVLDTKRILFMPDKMKDYTVMLRSINYGRLLVPGEADDYRKGLRVVDSSSLMPQDGTSRAEVELVVNNIVAELTGVDVREITPEKKLADDLGID